MNSPRDWQCDIIVPKDNLLHLEIVFPNKVCQFLLGDLFLAFQELIQAKPLYLVILDARLTFDGVKYLFAFSLVGDLVAFHHLFHSAVKAKIISGRHIPEVILFWVKPLAQWDYIAVIIPGNRLG